MKDPDVELYRPFLEEAMKATARIRAGDIGDAFAACGLSLPEADMSFRSHMDKVMRAGGKAGKRREEG
jgi:hypothetical protein